MLHKVIVSLVLVLTLNKNLMLSSPIDVLKPFQIHFNGSNILAYQGFEKRNNRNVAQNREKRFLDDIMELLNLFDDYFYSDEADLSSEEQSSELQSNKSETINKKHELCRNCSVTFNKINQVQHINDAGQPLNTQQSRNTIKRQEAVSSKSKVPASNESLDAKRVSKPTSSTEFSEKSIYTASTQAATRKKPLITTESSSSSTMTSKWDTPKASTATPANTPTKPATVKTFTTNPSKIFSANAIKASTANLTNTSPTKAFTANPLKVSTTNAAKAFTENPSVDSTTEFTTPKAITTTMTTENE